MKARVLGVVVLLLLAPVTAELLQAYLGDLGGPVGLISFVVFLAPLYGGAALVIREVCLRTGRGWPGRLLLAAAFGVAMPTFVDQSLFIADRADIDGWGPLVRAASAGGIGWYVAALWTLGHVLLSITAPTVLAETLARRPGPWLGRIGLLLVAAACLGVALLLHSGPEGTVVATGLQRGVAAAAVLLLAASAFTPLGRPVTLSGRGRCPRPWVLGVGAAALLAVVDLTPPGWPGLTVVLLVAVGGGLAVLRAVRSGAWTQRHSAAVAMGLVLERLAIGLLSPVTGSTTVSEKYAQSAVYLVLLLVLGALADRATRRRPLG